MDEAAARYRKVARAFSDRVDAVPEEAWGNPSPCEGWDARDVVRHLTEWLPAFFFDRWDLEAPAIPSVDEDPAGAWRAVDGTIRAALDDPDVAGRERDTPLGPRTFEAAIDEICTGDVLIHTWDLARAAGLDDRLDPDEVHRHALAMAPHEEAMRSSGHFGPPVEPPPGADEQDRVLAFTGRRP